MSAFVGTLHSQWQQGWVAMASSGYNAGQPGGLYPSQASSPSDDQPGSTQYGKRCLAKELGGVPRSASPVAQGTNTWWDTESEGRASERWWEYEDSQGNIKIVVEHRDGSVHVGRPKPHSQHHQGGNPQYYPEPGTGHVGE